MAIKQLTDEQVREWSLEQKDRWWRDEVYKGDMPQLTLRSALTGMALGGILSLTNLYVGAKTGWTLGVGITSVILAFSMWKVFARLGVEREFSLLENNCMQSIATAAGYMTGPLISSLAAYMMITETIIPMWQLWIWIVVVGILGVLFAFPFKRRFINDEQHPFPEGRAAAVVMDALHSGDEKDGLLKGQILAVTAAIASLVSVMKSERLMSVLGLPFHIPEYVDGWVHQLMALKIGGVDLRELTVRADSDIVLMAAGGLMGIRTGVSLLVGAIASYLFLAPYAIGIGDIHPNVADDGTLSYGFGVITKWCLWPGVAAMTTASLFAFFSRPQILISAVTSLFAKREERGEDVLADIELPLRVFFIGIPILGAVVVFLAWAFFGVHPLMGAIAVPLVLFFTLIAVNSTALTSITPVGALGKLTQLTFGILAPGNMTTNIMTAGITGEVASNSSNLLMDIKPGYMLGAKPRQQAIGHVLGIFAGSLAAVPIFYLVFLHDGPAAIASGDFKFPSATVWKSVAEMLTLGLDNLSMSARWATLWGALAGIAIEALRFFTKGRFWLSGVAVGLAFVIPFHTCFAMFLGAFLFWAAGKLFTEDGSVMKRVFVDNLEPTCAGLIAGGALTGILVVILTTFAFPG